MRKAIPTGYTHAKVGGPPYDWMELLVVDLDTGCIIHNLEEVNTEEGVLRRRSDVLPKNLDEWPIEIVQGRFEIRRIVDIERTDHVKQEDSIG